MADEPASPLEPLGTPNRAPERSAGRSAERSGRSHRSGRSGRSRRSASSNRGRVVSALKVFQHVLLAAAYLNVMLLAHTGLLEWREDEWALLLIVASAAMGAHVSFLGLKFMAWKKKRRDSRALSAFG